MMGKLLILALVVVLALWPLFGRRSREGSTSSRRQAGRDGPRSEAMVKCAHCGVHLPRGEALAARGRHYCSLEHRDAKVSAGR
jgi:uncharacterized protein